MKYKELLQFSNYKRPKFLKNRIRKACLVTCVIVCFLIVCQYSIYNRDVLHGFTFASYSNNTVDRRWTWNCSKNICRKQPYGYGKQISLDTCNMLCGEPQLWPKPKYIIRNTKNSSAFFPQQFYFQSVADDPVKTDLNNLFTIFKENVNKLVKQANYLMHKSDINQFNILINVTNSRVTKLNLDTDESYLLRVDLDADLKIAATINATTYFGARHGLETLSQLIWWDDFYESGMLKVLHGIDIYDKPAFPYRGLMVDTARNFFRVRVLKNIIEGMAANKLNVFHWHMTDAQSFSFYPPSVQFLGANGVYGFDMVYTAADVREVIDFAKVRGVRVIIEIDAPAHTLSGWEWKNDRNKSDLVIKSRDGFNGQLNPENPLVFTILKRLYGDVLGLMDNDELFHIGGDEVDLELWRDLKAAQNYIDLTDLWAKVLQDIIQSLSAANGNRSPKNIILWSSTLTEHINLPKYLDKNNVIIQHWYGDASQIMANGFRVIYSSVKYWYLDCGFGAWRENANPNCDPYRTWQTFYQGTPWSLYNVNKTVGGEACLWSEQVGEHSVETRIWPRAAAFAERIWSNPPPTYLILKRVYTRLDTQRSRLLSRGIKSEVLWPQWCTQNPEIC